MHRIRARRRPPAFPAGHEHPDRDRTRFPGAAAAIRLFAGGVALVASFVFLDSSAALAIPAESVSGAEEASGRKLARITYLTSTTIYVDAGSDAGLEVGRIIEVVRGDSVVATLRVTFVSSNRAACVRESGDVEVRVNDTVRFAAVPAPAGAAPPGEAPGSRGVETPPAATSPQADEKRRRDLRGDGGIHGRIGVRYLAVRDTLSGGATVSQPAVDLRLDGRQVGGSPLDLTVDLRSRRTTRTDPAGVNTTDDQTRLYRLAAAWQAKGSPWRATVGRQFSPSLASVNIFDGFQGEYRAARFGAGLFSGTQPDPVDMGYASLIREHGGFVEWRNAPGAGRRWAITTGLVGSYQEGEINREFSFLQGSFYGPRFSAWLAQEVDLNRGWKEDAEGSGVSMTSTFANFRWRASGALSFNAGYDNRRSVRLYRDRITPVTAFDDAYRTGGWVGAEATFASRFRAGLDLRTSAGGSLGGADGYTLTLGADRLTALGLGARTRSTRYTTEQVEGWIHSLSLGIAPGGRWRVEASGGVRDETNLSDPSLDGTLNWYGLDFDLALGRSWFFAAALERSHGRDEAVDQIYTSLAYRF